MEKLSSDPCLLDELMDTGIIDVDIPFGGLGQDEFLKTKRSPSHESDSGVSIMSSPQHSIASEIDVDDDLSFKAFSPPCFETLDSLLDTGLENYLSGDSNDATCVDVSSSLSVSPAQTVAQNVGVPRFEHQLSNDSQDSQTYCRLTSATKAVGTNELNNNNNRVSLPPVKIIKVISAPKSTSRPQLEQEIYDAIDEKNKKNAKQAKINREKKKAYINSLEEDVNSLKTENTGLKDKMNKLEHHKNALAEEVEYLKSVLANQSTLSALLKNIPNANVKLSCSYMSRKRSAAHDHDYQGQLKPTKKAKTAGICLHVENENVSLEFCASCSKNAQQDGS